MVYYPPEKRFDLEKIMNQDIDSSNFEQRKKEKKKKQALEEIAKEEKKAQEDRHISDDP